MDSEKRISEGLKAYEEAVRFDDIAETKEDRAGVEETYWTAHRLLSDSTDPEHVKICEKIRHRIAQFLEAEGRHKEAQELIRKPS